MIKILSAKDSDYLGDEWHKLDMPHYGKPIHWTDKDYFFKAVENDEIVATIEGKYESGVLYIAALITKERARGNGIGTLLIKRAEEFGKKYGAHRTWLVTGKHWDENAFYKKLGFELIAELPDFYFHTDFVIYTRRIR